MKVLAVVPARAGSKRVPKKNVRPLLGIPLVCRSILHAINASKIDDIVVTTDDKEVIEIAKRYSCTIIKRPAYLADDSATTIDVVKHTIEYLKNQGKNYDAIVLLQPTVPFRAPNLIDKSISLLEENLCDSVISHLEVDYFHPNRMKKIKDGFLAPYCEPEVLNVPRSKLTKAYYRDGSIYCVTVEALLRTNSFLGDTSKLVITEAEEFVNVDSERDWLTAEMLAEDLDQKYPLKI